MLNNIDCIKQVVNQAMNLLSCSKGNFISAIKKIYELHLFSHVRQLTQCPWLHMVLH